MNENLLSLLFQGNYLKSATVYYSLFFYTNRITLYSENVNPKYSLFILLFKPLFIIHYSASTPYQDGWIFASFFFCEFMDLDFVSVHKHANKELGQYPAILTSHLVNNPYVLHELSVRKNSLKRTPCWSNCCKKPKKDNTL